MIKVDPYPLQHKANKTAQSSYTAIESGFTKRVTALYVRLVAICLYTVCILY